MDQLPEKVPDLLVRQGKFSKNNILNGLHKMLDASVAITNYI